jgi:glycolate oxidase
MFQKISPKIVSELELIVGKSNLYLDLETLTAYGSDQTEDLVFKPEVLVKPKTVGHIQQILKLCNQHEIPVTPIGAMTGLSGGALCVHGGLGLSMELFNNIIDIDENNLQVTVEPGVITQVLQEAVAEKALFYPPDPASKGSCFIGGNLAENSGGPKAVKYGVTADYVLNLEVVLANGEKIWTGANVLKNATGYNLTQLIVGSEGTLGIITKAVLRLIPLPVYNLLMLVPFKKANDACKAVAAIFKAGVTPSGMEFMEREAILFTLKWLPNISLVIQDDEEAHLLIEVDGSDQEVLMNDMEIIQQVVSQYDISDILFADDEAQKNTLWEVRRKVGEALKSHTIYKEEDTVVPRYELANLLAGVKAIGSKYGFKSVCYGHAGDGNLHVNIIKDNLSKEEWEVGLKKGIEEIFQLTVSLGGTISGEHGIGWVQKEFMGIAFNQVHLDLMKKIKQVFDPNGIMNPSKIFPN